MLNPDYQVALVPLGYFLSSDDQTTLQIPHYQRGYSWTKEHVSDFFGDLYDHIDEKSTYYLGTITTIRRDPKGNVEVYELVDGQQRLTTAMILLACIRDKFHELEESHYEEDVKEEIFNKDVEEEDVHCKLILDLDDDLFFRDHVLKVPESGSHKFANARIEYETQVNLKNAYLTMQKLIGDELDDKSQKDPIKFLNKLRTTLRKKFYVTNLQVSNAGNAYILFDRMNDRGLNLAPSDLVKELILALIDDEFGRIAAEEAVKRWRKLENKLSKQKIMINSYIHHYLVTFYPTNIVDGEEKFVYTQKTKIFGKLRDIFNDESKRITAKDFLNDLLEKSSDYETLISYRFPHLAKAPGKILSNDKISANAEYNIKWINELGIITIYPVLMAGLIKYKKEDFEKLSNILLKWFFRVKSIANRNATKLEIQLASITHRMMKGDPKLNRSLNIDDVRDELKLLDISSTVFNSYLSELELGTKQSKCFLAKIIEAKEGKKIVDLMFPTSLEHIMPNEIDKSICLENGQETTWLKYIQEVNGNMSEDAARLFHQLYKNRMGNLTLISQSKNSRLGANPFDIKCKAYHDSHIMLTQDITKYDKWDKDAIERRHNYLVEIAKEEKIWEI